jgi:hypothetical protein
MSSFQKTVKYGAITFAVLLTVIILTGVVSLASGVAFVLGDEQGEGIDFNKEFLDVEKLDISHSLGKLNIKTGDGFRVEATNVSEKFSANVVDGTLIIDETDSFNIFFTSGFGTTRNKSVITIYVPEDFNAKSIEIDCGVGDIYMEDISSDFLSVDAGVGKIYGRNITSMKVNADSGVGDIDLVAVNFSNMTLEGGIGDISIEGIILGKSDIDCGLGNVNLQIRGSREEYALSVDSSLGRVKVNDKKVSREYQDNYKAESTIVIDGGMGDVDIDFTH